jgi:hypothetical protein
VQTIHKKNSELMSRGSGRGGRGRGGGTGSGSTLDLEHPAEIIGKIFLTLIKQLMFASFFFLKNI